MKDGPTVSNGSGKLIEPSEIDEMLTELVFICYHKDPYLFPVDMNTEDKIRDNH